MTAQLIAFWAGGAVACLLLTRQLRSLTAGVFFSLCWPVSIIYGMHLVQSDRKNP